MTTTDSRDPELGSSAAIVAALLAPLLFLVTVAEARYISNLSRGSGITPSATDKCSALPQPLLKLKILRASATRKSSEASSAATIAVLLPSSACGT